MSEDDQSEMRLICKVCDKGVLTLEKDYLFGDGGINFFGLCLEWASIFGIVLSGLGLVISGFCMIVELSRDVGSVDGHMPYLWAFLFSLLVGAFSLVGQIIGLASRTVKVCLYCNRCGAIVPTHEKLSSI